MERYICKVCGYSKARPHILEYVLEPPVYPFMTTSSILPFMAMHYMWDHDEVCPNCKKSYS